MFTQLVMISTIILLVSAGNKIFRKSKKINYLPGRLLSFGLFFIALGIFSYAVRDIFVQLEEHRTQLIFLRIGGFTHILGCVFILWFLSKEFAPEKIRRIMFLACLLIVIASMVGIALPLWESEIIQAPFEPFSYKVVRNFLSGPGLIIEILLVIFGSAFLIGIILYNIFKLEDKNLRKKGLFYGFSFLLLFLPIFICNLISPIYARWGYLLGAILLYSASRMRV